LLGQESSIDLDALPYGPDDEQSPAGIETVVLAEPVKSARGKVLEEVLIKREAGGMRRVVVNHVGDEEDHDIIEIKAEPET
jgi:DEAD/DEAH box helicase domain-containing protein